MLCPIYVRIFEYLSCNGFSITDASFILKDSKFPSAVGKSTIIVDGVEESFLSGAKAKTCFKASISKL